MVFNMAAVTFRNYIYGVNKEYEYENWLYQRIFRCSGQTNWLMLNIIV